MNECIHQMDSLQCALCSPPGGRSSQPSAAGSFVRVSSSTLYHLPECAEVNWDPAEAKFPGERTDMAAAEVKKAIGAGELTRGCRICGANADVPARGMGRA